MSENNWYTHSVNTAECFEYRGFFVVVLDASREIFVPRLRGMCRIGNLLHVPKGTVKKPLAPEFIVTVGACEPFSLPAAAVREIRDENRELICIRVKGEESIHRLFRFGKGRRFYDNTNYLCPSCWRTGLGRIHRALEKVANTYGRKYLPPVPVRGQSTFRQSGVPAGMLPLIRVLEKSA